MGRLIIVAVVGVIVLALGGVGGYFARSYFFPPATQVAKAAPPPPEDSGVPNPDLMYDLPEMLVTLRSERRSDDQILKIAVSVVVPSQGDLDKLQAYLPRVLDAFQVYVRTLTMKDLRGVKNLSHLRGELREHLEAVIAPGRVSKVLFREIALQ